MQKTTLHNQLVEAVRRLTASSMEQERYLRKINTYPSADELALEFHDLAMAPKRLSTEAGVSEEALALIARLDERLNRFSGEAHADEWHASALAKSANWAEVRNLAEIVLEALK